MTKQRLKDIGALAFCIILGMIVIYGTYLTMIGVEL